MVKRTRWRLYAAVRSLATLFALVGCVGCGSNAAPVPTSPSPGETTSSGWVLNSDPDSSHLGTFTAADGTVLDVWRGDGAGVSDFRIKTLAGARIEARTDTVDRPLYFRDKSGSSLWINEYHAEGTADATITNAGGESWRGVILLGAPTGLLSAAVPADSSLRSTVLGNELETLQGRFCSKEFQATLSLVLTGTCAITVAAAVLTGGFTVPGAILACAPTVPLLDLLDAQMCSYVRQASASLSDPARVTSAPLTEVVSPLPRPPDVPRSVPSGTQSLTATATFAGSLGSNPGPPYLIAVSEWPCDFPPASACPCSRSALTTHILVQTTTVETPAGATRYIEASSSSGSRRLAELLSDGASIPGKRLFLFLTGSPYVPSACDGQPPTGSSHSGASLSFNRVGPNGVDFGGVSIQRFGIRLDKIASTGGHVSWDLAFIVEGTFPRSFTNARR